MSFEVTSVNDDFSVVTESGLVFTKLQAQAPLDYFREALDAEA